MQYARNSFVGPASYAQRIRMPPGVLRRMAEMTPSICDRQFVSRLKSARSRSNIAYSESTSPAPPS